MKALVLAAGKGTRLMSQEAKLPKVLREANGRPLISYVLDNVSFIDKADTVVVVGYMAETVMDRVGSEYKYALQAEQNGTGHAVMCAKEHFEGYDGNVLILYGDMPLFKKETYKAIVEEHEKSGAALTLLTSVVDNPPAYGRIIRDADNKICDIVEQKDATEEQAKINELNVGIYVADSRELFEALKNVKNNNAQGEYYLTDVPKILIEQGKKVESYTIYNTNEIYGVNTLEDLAFCENILREDK